MDAGVAVLLALAVVVQIACCVCLLLLDNVLDRLHLLGLASNVSALAVTLAVWLEHGLGSASLKVSLIFLIVVTTGPILASVTARATVEHSEKP